MAAVRNLLLKPGVAAFLGLLVGLFIGLVILGWWLFPVRWVGGTLEVLDPALQLDYLRMAVDSYLLFEDETLAEWRYELAGPNREALLAEIYANPAPQDPRAVAAFSLAAGAGDPSALNPEPVAPVRAPEGVFGLPVTRVGLAALCALFLFLLIGMSVILALLGRSRPKAEPVQPAAPPAPAEPALDDEYYIPTAAAEPFPDWMVDSEEAFGEDSGAEPEAVEASLPPDDWRLDEEEWELPDTAELTGSESGDETGGERGRGRAALGAAAAAAAGAAALDWAADEETVTGPEAEAAAEPVEDSVSGASEVSEAEIAAWLGEPLESEGPESGKDFPAGAAALGAGLAAAAAGLDRRAETETGEEGAAGSEEEAATVIAGPEPEQGGGGLLQGINRDLEYVEGIGPAYAQRLREAGVSTPAGLLQRGATPRGRKEIAETSGISPRLILKWVNHVDLFRIKGVGQEYAELLEAAGVDTVVELARRNPENLHQKLLEVNESKRLVRQTPGLGAVRGWIDQAGELPRVVEY